MEEPKTRPKRRRRRLRGQFNKRERFFDPQKSTQACEDAGNIVLLGNPNVGKSVIFYYLTGKYAEVSNFPGTTVNYLKGFSNFCPNNIIDTPGIYKLTPISEDEKNTRDILIKSKPEVVVIVGDAKNIRRTLLFTIEAIEMGFNVILNLNLMDEAERNGIEINLLKLSELLQVNLNGTVAVEGKGIKELKRKINDFLVNSVTKSKFSVQYTQEIENGFLKFQELTKNIELPFNPRAFFLQLLEEDEDLKAFIPSHLKEPINQLTEEISNSYSKPISLIINQKREDAVKSIIEESVKFKDVKKSKITEKLNDLTLQPKTGVPILIGVLALVFLFVGFIGAQLLVELLEGFLFSEIINPYIGAFFRTIIPANPVGYVFIEILVGEFGILTTGITWSFGLVLPIVFTFFLAFVILEDTGYLPRVGYLLNQGAQKAGLNGKAIIPMILGYGCGAMATMSTRVLDTKKERTISTLLIALSIPCSAQLGIILGLAFSAGPLSVILIMFVVTIQVVFVGYLASKLVKGDISCFILEIPPLRVPKLKNIIKKTSDRIIWFIKEAVPLFIIGVFIVSILKLTGGIYVIALVFRPITFILNLPPEAALAIVLGFIRRDIGATSLVEMNLTFTQTVVGFSLITLFLPCMAAMIMIIKERGIKTSLGIFLFVIGYSVLISYMLNLILSLFIWI
ncbi:MAG: ferrous iron transport protein B [Candidatus Lokiarchaeota archaeon]|nr:ferrous iron transport protein B [Candidatus Lokiarchaeota archaeon]